MIEALHAMAHSEDTTIKTFEFKLHLNKSFVEASERELELADQIQLLRRGHAEVDPLPALQALGVVLLDGAAQELAQRPRARRAVAAPAGPLLRGDRGRRIARVGVSSGNGYRSPISAMTLTPAELDRAMEPSSVLFPTPLPPKIPMR